MKFKLGLLVVLAAAVVAGVWLIDRRLPPVPSSAPTASPAPPVTPPDRAPSAPAAPDPVAILEKKADRPPPLLDTPLPPNSRADRIVVEKKARLLTLFHQGQPLKTYAVALGRQPEGPKQFQGDNKTPEGRYRIDARKKNSSYHRALHISYPNPQDRAFAAGRGRSAGENIMIHGLPNGLGALGPLHRRRDWTAGCIAVTNAEIEELWRAVPDGTPIEIRP